MHNIEYFTYPASMSIKEIKAELDEYVRERTAEEGGHGLYNPIRAFEGTVHKSFEDAKRWLEERDRAERGSASYKNYAVVYRQLPKGVTSPKLEELRVRICDASKHLQIERGKVPVKEVKAAFVGCKACGSKLNKEYLSGNFCPVCRADLRSDTQKKKLDALKKKVEDLEQKIKAEEQKLMDKKAVLMWLVKIEYHT